MLKFIEAEVEPFNFQAMRTRKSKRDLRRDKRHELKAKLKTRNTDDLECAQKMQSRPRSEYTPKQKGLLRKLEIAELLVRFHPVEDVIVEDPSPPFIPVFCVNIRGGHMEICLN